MPKYRGNLPQMNGRKYITDGGLETTLIFHEGLELPEFAAFDLVKKNLDKNCCINTSLLTRRLPEKITLVLLEGPTWRASASWGEKLGLPRCGLDHNQPAGDQSARRCARRIRV